MSTERHTYCEREGISGCGGVVVGVPMFWKAPTSVLGLLQVRRRLGDSFFLLSLFNLKQKHHLNPLVGKLEQNLELGQTCELS